jgi:hypothetical protein
MNTISFVLLPQFILRLLAWALRLWSGAVPYLSQLLLGLAAFLALLKDWNDYGRLSRRFGKAVPLCAALIILGITFLGVQDTYQTRAAATVDKQQAQLDQKENQVVIEGLSSQVQQLRQDNQTATGNFSRSFSTLYEKFSNLQSKVQNADLLREIQETKQELTDTQKKLTQPKATLIATFPVKDASEVPITEANLAKVDGVVTVPFTVYNSSDVVALNGVVHVRLCELCKFGEEPVGFRKIPGTEDTDREFDFEHVFPRAVIQTISVKVQVPISATRVAFAVFIPCDTCVAPTKQDLWINIK